MGLVPRVDALACRRVLDLSVAERLLGPIERRQVCSSKAGVLFNLGEEIDAVPGLREVRKAPVGRGAGVVGG